MLASAPAPASAPTVVLDTNGVTVKYTGLTIPSDPFIYKNVRGSGPEWFMVVNDSYKTAITNYANDVQNGGISVFTRSGDTIPVPFNNIVTTLLTDMNNLFYSNTFNHPIASWDTSNVVNMNSTFINANAFNQPIGSWNTMNVTTMTNMFNSAFVFNQSIGSWNTSKVNDMTGMFYAAPAFNQPIGSWDTSNVISMRSMFCFANTFNQPIGSWNTSNVINMDFMFNYASAFNQNIRTWNVSKVSIKPPNGFYDSSALQSNPTNQPIW